MKTKKIPLRMCVGCSTMKPKKELVRVVKTPEGSFSVDAVGKQNGRGAYVCRNQECLKKAQKAHRFETKLGGAIPEEIYQNLLSEIEEA